MAIARLVSLTLEVQDDGSCTWRHSTWVARQGWTHWAEGPFALWQETHTQAGWASELHVASLEAMEAATSLPG
jgi:hypothetical protein